VTGLGSATVSGGVATQSVTGALAGSITITALAGTLSSDSTTFGVVAGAADRLVFTSSTADFVAGSTRTLTVEVRDAAGNLELGDNTTSVTFAKTAGAGVVTALGSATASSGVATKNVTGALAGSITISATAGSLTPASTAFSVVAGAADHLTFTSPTAGLGSGNT